MTIKCNLQKLLCLQTLTIELNKLKDTPILSGYLSAILDVYSSLCGISCDSPAIYEIRYPIVGSMRKGLLDACFYSEDTVKPGMVDGVPFLDIVQFAVEIQGYGVPVPLRRVCSGANNFPSIWYHYPS